MDKGDGVVEGGPFKKDLAVVQRAKTGTVSPHLTICHYLFMLLSVIICPRFFPLSATEVCVYETRFMLRDRNLT